MTGCSAWHDALADRLADDEEPARRAQLDEHLARCAGCRSELRALEGISATLRRLGRAARNGAASRRYGARANCPTARWRVVPVS
jgi:predicted anti-sigma-YlaC factor YlaD